MTKYRSLSSILRNSCCSECKQNVIYSLGNPFSTFIMFTVKFENIKESGHILNMYRNSKRYNLYLKLYFLTKTKQIHIYSYNYCMNSPVHTRNLPPILERYPRVLDTKKHQFTRQIYQQAFPTEHFVL